MFNTGPKKLYFEHMFSMQSTNTVSICFLKQTP